MMIDKMKKIVTRVLLKKNFTKTRPKDHQGFQTTNIQKKNRLKSQQTKMSTRVQETNKLNGDQKTFFTNSIKRI